LRQFVATETLISGTRGVKVKVKVGVKVWVGVSVGGSGVKVYVGVDVLGGGVKVGGGAERVIAAITVCATEVLSMFGSTVGTTGNPQATTAGMDRIARTNRSNFFMLPLS
jgi:hypothetical protein